VKQDVLQLEPVARGRFEKIEPTIVEGEDLDVPTFLRLKLKKKPPL
jgi:cell division protein FtsZ